jgi:hypothetical protein
MSLKAYAVTCPKYYPNRVVHYAAHDAIEASYFALAAIRRVGGMARTDDIECHHVPELDKVATNIHHAGMLPRELVPA